MAKGKISARWRRQAEVYLYFSRSIDGLDRSETAAGQMFEAESTGAEHDLSRNAYYWGKHWANVQVDEWKAGIRDRLFLAVEFLEDPEIPRWWTEKVLGVTPGRPEEQPAATTLPPPPSSPPASPQAG